jgi:hypothetical protein
MSHLRRRRVAGFSLLRALHCAAYLAATLGTLVPNSSVIP